MKVLHGREARIALECLAETVLVAQRADCLRSKCGATIYSLDELIGKGFNSPPGNDESQRRCLESKDLLHRKVTDKTCCVHAEEMAMIDTLGTNPKKIVGARLYFVRLGKNGEPKRSREPYCTLCSKMAVAVGLSEFVLWREEGVCVYDTKEYNLLSFKYQG